MTAGRSELRLRAPAKVNLYLEVLGRRADGYHELVTVLQAIDLCDEVTLRLRPRRREREGGASNAHGRGPAPEVRLELAGSASDVPADATNLAARAAALVLTQAGAAADLSLDVRLDKRIPPGGGLGGGSSDAAAVLSGLNRLLGEPLDGGELAALAASLGSDVAFFLHGGTALCTGRGERVLPIGPPRPFAVTLLLPPFGTPTPSVYGALSAAPLGASAARERADALDTLRRGFHDADADALERLFRNDLERPARAVEPRLGELLDRTRLHLSGSGSTLFGYGRLEEKLHSECQPTSICVAQSLGGNH